MRAARLPREGQAGSAFVGGQVDVVSALRHDAEDAEGGRQVLLFLAAFLRYGSTAAVPATHGRAACGDFRLVGASPLPGRVLVSNKETSGIRPRRLNVHITEWTGGKGAKQPHLFTAADGSPVLAFAGLWDRWRDPATREEILSCTIIVSDASAWMEP